MFKFFQRILYTICISCRSNKSHTVNLAFPLVFAAATFLGAAALLHDDVSYVRIETTSQNVSAEEEFSIKVYAGAHVPVNAIDIALSFPEDQIKVKGIDVGESVITIWTREPYIEDGRIIMQGGTFRKGFMGGTSYCNYRR